MKKSLFPFFVITLLCATAAYAQRGLEWLKNAVIYHIYPSSFQDSDGDGIGDLEGIRSRLDYVKACGFNTIWLSPVFESPFEDGGYDITDYYKVDPRFGTNTQLVELIRDAMQRESASALDSWPDIRRINTRGSASHAAPTRICNTAITTSGAIRNRASRPRSS